MTRHVFEGAETPKEKDGEMNVREGLIMMTRRRERRISHHLFNSVNSSLSFTVCLLSLYLSPFTHWMSPPFFTSIFLPTFFITHLMSFSFSFYSCPPFPLFLTLFPFTLLLRKPVKQCFPGLVTYIPTVLMLCPVILNTSGLTQTRAHIKNKYWK